MAGADIRSKACYLQWNGLTKAVPYQTSSALPILYTLPGGKTANFYITQHMHTFSLHNNKWYLAKKVII